MFRSIPVTMVILMIAIGSQAHAQGATESNKAMMKASGEADAIALVCGKLSEAQIKAHKAKTRQL